MKTNNKPITNPIKSNSFRKLITNFIDETNIIFLLFFPIFLGFGFMILATFIIKSIIQIEITDNCRSIIFSISSFIAGFGGLFQILKKEYFGPFKNTRITRIIAIINGVGVLCFFWASSILFIIIVIFKIK